MCRVMCVVAFGSLVLTIGCGASNDLVDDPFVVPVNTGFATAPDGVRLYYAKYGEGPPALIVLHGSPSRSNAYAPDFAPLFQRHTVLFYDQRGGGRSDLVTDFDQFSWRDHVADLEAIRAHHGLERVSLLGKSWGSGLATLYAAEFPGRVDRLILIPMRARRATLISGPAPMDPADERRMGELMGSWEGAEDPRAFCEEYWTIVGRQDPWYLPKLGDHCDEPTEALRWMWRTSQSLMASLGDWDWRPALAQVGSPALVMRGGALPDPIGAAREWLDALPNSRLLIVPEARGFEWVVNPDFFFEAVDTFLQGAWPPESVMLSDFQ